jgi:tRNA A37 N6-isopentenylltransferase MiaA
MDAHGAYLKDAPSDHNHANKIIQEVKSVDPEVKYANQPTPKNQTQWRYDAVYFVTGDTHSSFFGQRLSQAARYRVRPGDLSGVAFHYPIKAAKRKRLVREGVPTG